jgi:hypothetical protein
MTKKNQNQALESYVESAPVDQVPRAARFALLKEGGASDRRARDLAGYSPTTVPHRIKSTAKYREFKQRIREQRAELSAKRGYTLQDSAKFYRLLSESAEAAKLRKQAMQILEGSDPDAVDKAKQLLSEADNLEVSPAARIRARERLDKLLGHDAPFEVEHEDNTEQRPVVALIEVLQQLEVSPIQLRAILDDKSPGGIADAVVLPDGAGDEDTTAQPGVGWKNAPGGDAAHAEGCPLDGGGVGGGPDSASPSPVRDPLHGPKPTEKQAPEAIPKNCPDCGCEFATNPFCWTCAKAAKWEYEE